MGAPVRNFTRFTYSLDVFDDGRTYLGRAPEGGDWVPLVGPLMGTQDRPGLEFEYLDEYGAVTNVAARIRQIRERQRHPGGGLPVRRHPHAELIRHDHDPPSDREAVPE